MAWMSSLLVEQPIRELAPGDDDLLVISALGDGAVSQALHAERFSPFEFIILTLR